jgi:hypothetical protein
MLSTYSAISCILHIPVTQAFMDYLPVHISYLSDNRIDRRGTNLQLCNLAGSAANMQKTKDIATQFAVSILRPRARNNGFLAQ